MAGTECIVIGAGVVGSSIAWHLAKRGASVTLVDRHDVAAAASSASAGGVRQQGRDLRELPLAIAAISHWERLEEELDADLHYYREGHVSVAEDEADIPLLEERIAAQHALGLDLTLVQSDAIRDLIPGISPSVVAGTYSPNDGHANPTLTTRAFAAAAERDGARILRDTPVTGFLRASERVTGVETPAGPMWADHVVVAAGAWTASLLEPLGFAIPIVPHGLQMILTDERQPLLKQVLGSLRRRVSLKQLRDGQYLIGGGWPGDVDLADSYGATRPESIAGSRDDSSAIFPALRETEIAASWVGIEGIASDQVPILGALPGYDGLWIAAGFSGHGFALSPAVGQTMAELMLDGAPSISLDAFHFSRFDTSVPSPTEPSQPTAG